MSVLQILIVLVGVGINFSHANYVHQKSPNEFDIELEEQGVRITQKIRFENGLTITEVPDHHNISSGTFVFDEKMVNWLSTIFKSMFYVIVQFGNFL